MADRRIGEHVGAVAERRDDEACRARRAWRRARRRGPSRGRRPGRAQKNVPGFSRAQWSARSGYSLKMMASSPDRLADRAARYSGEMVAPGRDIFGELRAPHAHALGQPGAAAPRYAASAICRRVSTRFDQRFERLGRRRPGSRDRSGTSASDSARRPDPRRYGRRGSRPADAADAGSTAHRIPAR